MLKARTPQKHQAYVKSFCRSVCPAQTPLYVPLEPLPNKPISKCFSIVPEHIAAHGGSQLFGWAILEVGSAWLEAEFHTVWEREDGELIDLTPRPFATKKILFLPDPERHYEGRKVMPIMKALSSKKSVRRFINLSHKLAIASDESDVGNIQTRATRQSRVLEIQKEMSELLPIIAGNR